MKYCLNRVQAISFLFLLFYGFVLSNANAQQQKRNNKPHIALRVAAFNVEFGHHANAEEIGEMFKKWNLDIICFNEVPGGDWTNRVGDVLGMKYSYIGTTSSANHKDKYKSILSKTALIKTDEYQVYGEGWLPASTVKAVTIIHGIPIAIYALHISGWGDAPPTSQAKYLAEQILVKEETDQVLVMGDFNNHIDNPVMSVFKNNNFQNTWISLNKDLNGQWTSWDEYTKEKFGIIDHILFRENKAIKVKDVGIIELPDLLSDHKPIWAEFLLKKHN